jgi:putative FmdB family regulatory protein
MPIYDYRCDECGKTYDVFHKVREVEEDIVCPSCASRKRTRLISAPAVQMGSSTGSSPARDVPPCGDGSCCGGSCGLN